MKIAVSIVIVSYNRPTICAQTVDRFLPLLRDDIELVIVDQGPGSGLREHCARVAESYPQVTHIFLETPGTTRARNVGIQRAQGDIIVFVDDDVIPKPDLIDAHVATLADPTVGAVAGRVIEGPDQALYPVDPRAMDPRFGWMFTEFCYDRPVDLMTARGCNMSVRRDILLAIGGFDTHFQPPFFFREETDASVRIIRAGYRLRYNPAASLIHLAQPTGGTRSVKVVKGRVKQELVGYRRLFQIMRDDLYFQAKTFGLREQLYTIARTYRGFVGLSRWPWRLLAKNLCFVAALVIAQFRATRSHPPYFENQLRSEI